MSSTAQAINRRIVLDHRPVGEPTAANFRLEKQPVPAAGPEQLLLRTRYLSLDPYMRGRMSDAPSYAPPVAVGEVMTGQTVSVVEASNAAGFTVGDLVLATVGWQDYGVVDARHAHKIDPAIPRLSYALGVLGMPGLTAWIGLLEIGQPQPDETVVVSAATGGVGSVVGQIAKLKGCRVVGIAGGAEKCEFAVKTLGFDACLDHREPQLRERLAEAAPKGVDVYFENVGGAVFNAVLPLFNPGARMTICGLIAHYGDADGTDARAALMARGKPIFDARGVTVRGLFVGDYVADHHDAFLREVAPSVASGEIRYREDIRQGFETIPTCFAEMLRGDNFGKMLVQVGEDPTL
jgi:NADPH-dependent curcumin reductase